TKKALGWDADAPFHVPDAVRPHMQLASQRGAAAHAAWRGRFEAWRASFPELAAQWDAAFGGELPSGWDAGIPSWKLGATRGAGSASGKIMAALSKSVPWLLGGDADLGGSTKTIVPGGDYDRAGAGRNLRFGVREHAMGSIANGLAYHGGIRPFASAFFVFSDYLRPAARLRGPHQPPG